MIGIILLVIAIGGLVLYQKSLTHQYASLRHSALRYMEGLANAEVPLIEEKDLNHLPEPLKRYLVHAQVIGSPHVKAFKVTFGGQIKQDKNGEWLPLKAEQYSFIDEGRRLFYMTMKMKGLPVIGLHHYYADDASMNIKLLDCISVVNEAGQDMKASETVTWFNDLCLMAPGALVDAPVQWETIDETHVKGIIHEHGQETTAILTINQEGQLINFISEDRYEFKEEGEFEKVKWSTPMTHEKVINGIRIMTEGDAIWHEDEGDYPYTHLLIEDVIINPEE